MSPLPEWIDLRDQSGRLLARYDPARRLLEIGRRGELTLFDLARYDAERLERPTLTSQDRAPHGKPSRP